MTMFYLQDSRGYIGNDVVWWAKDGNVRPDYWLFKQEQWAEEPHYARNILWQPLPPAPEAA